MLVGQDSARTDGSASAYTSTATPYDALIQDGITAKIWDTPGLDGTGRTAADLWNVPAILSDINEISVIIFCHGTMCGRINKDVVEAFRILTSFFGKEGVSVALVVTGLELRENKEAWWSENQAHIKAMGMNFDHHACITSIKGGQAYEDSADVVRAMLLRCLAEAKPARALDIKRRIQQDSQTSCLSRLFG
ncbi:hypothetical protein HWV62_25786 [Athelia sp. TMB]|nr:hypothetical protein HWV62_25786 [Athelia sp. TMB]